MLRFLTILSAVSRLKRMGWMIGCLCFMTEAEGQRILCPEDYQSMLAKKLIAFEAGVGVKDWTGYTGTLGVACYLQTRNSFVRGQYHFPNMFLKANFDYVQDRIKGSGSTQMTHGACTLDLTFGYHPFDIKDIVYPTLLAGPFLTNDFYIASPDPVTDEVRDKLNIITPGGLIGFELMTFFGSPRFAVVLHADQRFLVKDTFWGNKRQYYWMGLRYYLMDVKRVKH